MPNKLEEYGNIIQLSSFRSNRSLMFFKIGVLKKSRKFHKKTLVLESLFNNVAGL